MALTTKRIIALPAQTEPQEGDYLAIDNAQGGTHKIPVGSVGVEVDDTLTEAGKAADAKAVGNALDEIRSQVEVTGTASGAIATFTDGAEMPAKSVIVNIEPQQSGTGTPSPDNVRPISGWESVTVADYAVNMLTEQTNEIQPCFIKAGEHVTASVKKVSGDGSCNFRYFRKDGSQIDYWTLSVEGDGRIWRTINIQEDVYFVSFTVTSTLAVTDCQVKLVAPGAEIYNPTLAHVATTDLGRTVYGGTLDVVSGVLTVTHGNIASYNGETLPSTWISDRDVYASGTTPTTGAQVVYELATPQTYTLTPTEVKTLLGENNVWADSGDVEVVYIRDLNIAINNLLNSNGTRSLGMMAMSAPTENTAEEPTDEQTEEPSEDDMR